MPTQKELGDTKPQPPKETKPKAMDAFELRDRKHRIELTKKAEQTKSDLDRYQYYLQCPEIDGHHGIYFNCDPWGKELTIDDWFSTYHKLGEPYLERDIECQECLALGKHTALTVTYTSFRNMPRDQRQKRPFRVKGRSSRFLAKFPLDEDEYRKTPILRAHVSGSLYHNTVEVQY